MVRCLARQCAGCWLRSLLLLCGFAGGASIAEAEVRQVSRPHLVLYVTANHPIELADQRGGEVASQTWTKHLPRLSGLATNGVVFSQAFSAATERHSALQAIYSGRFPTWIQGKIATGGKGAGSGGDAESRNDVNPQSSLVPASLVPDKEAVAQRTLTSHLKAMGYRLLLIGEQPEVSGNHFPLELLAKPSDLRLALGAGGGFDLAAWLASESRRDQRPVCLLIHDACDDSSTAAQQYETLDARIGAVHDAMAASFAERDTIFMFTSTHGVAERDLKAGQPAAMSDAVLRVPMVVAWAGCVAPARSEALVSTVDLLPTIVELAGGTPPSGIDGVSFAAIVRGDGHEHRDLIFAVHHPRGQSESAAAEQIDSPQNWGCLVRDQRFKLTHSHRTVAIPSKAGQELEAAAKLPVSERFIDTRSDPAEVRNQIDQPAHQDVLIELRDQLSSWMQRHGAAPPQRVLDQTAPNEHE